MIGLLITNLGTPEAPTAPALRKYLAQFLGDPRVVELPRALWLPILYGAILPFRPAKSAAKYAKIWTPEGSPLRVYTERQAKLLKGLLGQRRMPVVVDWAMRYGAPSIAERLDALAAQSIERIVVLPLYPQFAGSTTASTRDAVLAWQARHATPPVEFIEDYHTHPAYISALTASVREHTERHGFAEQLIMSFHGIPQRSVDRGDPYAKQCKATAQLLANALGLPPTAWRLCFQSRFGKAKWLEPYTQATVEQLARDGVKTIDVICPGFSSDCLETLEEISMEVRDAFLAAGGAELRYIPCLNDRADHIAALAEVIAPRLG